MSKFKAYIKDENGEVMLESTIVMLFTLFILIAMISVGFLFYQQAMLNTVAADIATDVATTFKLTDQEIGDNTLDPQSMKSVKLYRTTVALSSMRAKHKARANEYLPERVKLSSLGILKGDPVVDKLDITVDNVGRMHVDVTVSMECEILFGGALEYFGFMDSPPKFTASASAQCIDITAYASHVQFLDYVGRKIEGSNVDKVITTVIGIFDDAKSIKDILFG